MATPENPFAAPIPVLLHGLGKKLSKKKKERSKSKSLRKKKEETCHELKIVVKNAAADEVPPLSIEPGITFTLSEDEEESESCAIQPKNAAPIKSEKEREKIALIEEGLYTKRTPDTKTLERVVAEAIDASPAIASLRAVIEHNKKIRKLQQGLSEDIIAMHQAVNKELRKQFVKTMEELKAKHTFEMFELELQLLEAETDLEERTDELEKVSSILMQTQYEFYEKEILASSSSLPWLLLSPSNVSSSTPSLRTSSRNWGESAEC